MPSPAASSRRKPTVKELQSALERQTEAAAVLEAQRDQALDALAALMRQQNPSEYRTAPQQAALRSARALLAEHGR